MGTWGENSSEQLRYQTKLKNICIYKKKWLKKKGFFELTTFLERQYSDDSLYDSLGWVGVCWVSVWVFFLLLIQWYTALLRVQEKSLYSDDKMINPSCMTARYVWNEIWYFGVSLSDKSTIKWEEECNHIIFCQLNPALTLKTTEIMTINILETSEA